ncbi:hypothetical protein B7P43_G11486 [Cryptotermes secundus]|uniref:Uncharacterized protein n=1 Tax=Cryptotermes secundus TaxID=105785 RepID=A0A2J7PC26_9NEOP|nr:hypothetical protein B7P43_G11486 [Cryptotermes secundus]
MDAVYPEPLSRLHRRPVRKQMHRGSGGRYRTQPVTFAEIKEVDEENIEESPTNQATAGAASKSELDINSKFEEFWRAGREKAKEKKQRRAKETRKSESESGNVPTPTPTSTIITPTITTTPPHSTNKSRPSL